MAAGLLDGLDSVSETTNRSVGFLKTGGRFSNSLVSGSPLIKNYRRALISNGINILVFIPLEIKTTVKIFVDFKATHVNINNVSQSE